jgi:hypothetical protein
MLVFPTLGVIEDRQKLHGSIPNLQSTLIIGVGVDWQPDHMEAPLLMSVPSGLAIKVFHGGIYILPRD